MSVSQFQFDHPSATPQALNTTNMPKAFHINARAIHTAITPKALHTTAQGWTPQAAYPGKPPISIGYPEGVTQTAARKSRPHITPHCIEPFQGTLLVQRSAAQGSRWARQPWAMVCNAFSVGFSRAIFFTAMRLIFLAAILFVAASRSSAQVVTVEPDSPDDGPTTFKLTVSPAAEPRPALKYHFLVPPVDRIKGNAATFYYKALAVEGPDPFSELDKLTVDEEMSRRLFEAPFEQFPVNELKSILPLTDSIDSLRQASRCDYCDWGDPFREFGIVTLLPQAQRLRSVTRALAVQARQQIIQGNSDEAVDTLRCGYAMSRNLNHGVSLVQCLIGMAIQSILDEQTRAVIAANHSPNLYWALTELSAQPINLRQALSYETRIWQFSVHELAELDRRVLTPQEAIDLANQVQDLLVLARTGNRPKDQTAMLSRQGVVLATALAAYPQATAYLLQNGYTDSRINQMPIVQTVLLYWWKQFEVVRDNTFKWLFLPEKEAIDNLDRSNQAVRQASLQKEGGVFTTILPAIQASLHATIRYRRYIDMLRAVEALRMHAAEHGHWPEKLEDVTIVPVPVDPWTEKPFLYSLKDGVAILEMSPTPRAAGGLIVNHRYELTLREAKQK